MPDSLQVMDLIEMLNRIEDKSAPVVVCHEITPERLRFLKGKRWSEAQDVILVKRTETRAWAIVTEAPRQYQDGDEQR